MALIIKNLGKGAFPAWPNGADIAVAGAGKSVLVDNVIFVNKHASTAYPVKMWVRRSAIDVVVFDQNINAGTRLVFNVPTALDENDKLMGKSTGASDVEFLASGVQKDL